MAWAASPGFCSSGCKDPQLTLRTRSPSISAHHAGRSEAAQPVGTDQRYLLASDNMCFILLIRRELTMYERAEGSFGLPGSNETAWGTITFTLYDCGTGHASFSGIDGEQEMDFVRLAGLPGVGCP
jgi:hypothetical protein